METQKGLIKAEGLIKSRMDRIHLIGDPGCDGLGAGIMSIYAGALTASKADLSVIIGDMVPHGSRQIYQNFVDFTDSTARHPVYTLKGNHDTEFYSEYFGSPNYAIVSDDLLLIVLDNTGRKFSDEALSYCRQVLQNVQRDNIIIAFHYPPPNPIASNTINPPEWDIFRNIYSPYIDKICYFIAGHVHSMVVSSIDNVPILITGGAGARIEAVNPSVDESYIRHHIIEIYKADDGVYRHKYIFLDDFPYDKELEDPELKDKLENAFQNEILAHFKYGLMARNAEEQGWSGLSALFKALSDSEFYHAANHYSVLNQKKSVLDDLKGSIEGESWEVEHMYKEYSEYAEDHGHSLARYSFQDALNAEKVHKTLLEKAVQSVEQEEDIPVATYYTCTSCGYTFESNSPPQRCPVCGAPEDKISPVY